MNLATSNHARMASRAILGAAVLALLTAPAAAQNKKNSWEVFIYFGGFFANEVPSARQFGDVTTYRTEPAFAADPNNLSHVFVPNLGKVGGDQTGDPNYPFNTSPGNQFFGPPCNNDFGPLVPGDPRAPYFDECDPDQESRWRYNASGIRTNGEIQTDDSEFTLGIRGGYNITRHWQVEIDLGFGKQRLDLTRNLVPLLRASVNDIADPRARALADFYRFTWANLDYSTLVPLSGVGEHPNVVASRSANDPNFSIPMYFPLRPDDPGYLTPAGETFEDVTGFVNRVFQDPTAFRNRGNQINIDNFTLAGSVNYNFNTKADSRIVPYLSAGFGRWIRNFDRPWDGEDTDFLNYGGGIRFFVNEIFAFRADARMVNYLDDSFTIEGALQNFNLRDRSFDQFGGCERDQREIQPPCIGGPNVPAEYAFPNLNGGGGTALIKVEAELDDFFEIRIGFDVILGGK